jgi:hypothetical protein
MASEPSGQTYEIPRALFLALVFNAFGSVYWLSTLFGLGPWRSFLVGAALVTAAGLGWELEESPLPFSAAWALAASLVVNELLSRRTLVTASEIVVRSGLFGRRIRTYPLHEIRQVTYQYPWFGATLHVGDIEILGEGWALSLVAVSDPAEHAQRLLDRKRRA